MIYIISATEFEVEYLRNKYRKAKNIKFLITGIGILNAAINFLTYINKKNFSKKDMFLNVGIAGGFGNVNIGDICIAKKEVLGDFGVGFFDKIEYFSNNPSIVNINTQLTNLLVEKFHFNAEGTFLTVNCVTTSEKIIKFYEEKFNPICENMEGFPLSLICQNFNLNFAEIRVISNYMGQRENWEIKSVVKKLNEFMCNIMQYLHKYL